MTLKANLYALDYEKWTWNRPVHCSKEDRAKFDALPEGQSDQSVEVYDTERSLWLTVRRTHCGADCYCAAEIIQERGPMRELSDAELLDKLGKL